MGSGGLLPQPNSTQPRVGLALFSQTTTKTVSHFISAPTKPNSTKFSMQPYFNPTRRFKDHIQHATLIQPQLKDSCTEQ